MSVRDEVLGDTLSKGHLKPVCVAWSELDLENYVRLHVYKWGG